MVIFRRFEYRLIYSFYRRLDLVIKSFSKVIYFSDEKLLCNITSKYLMAISKKLWIISIEWILKCIEENRILETVKEKKIFSFSIKLF